MKLTRRARGHFVVLIKVETSLITWFSGRISLMRQSQSKVNHWQLRKVLILVCGFVEHESITTPP